MVMVYCFFSLICCKRLGFFLINRLDLPPCKNIQMGLQVIVNCLYVGHFSHYHSFVIFSDAHVFSLKLGTAKN